MFAGLVTDDSIMQHILDYKSLAELKGIGDFMAFSNVLFVFEGNGIELESDILLFQTGQTTM